MKHNLGTIPKPPRFTDHRDPQSYLSLNRYYNECASWFDRFERELKEHYQQYKELAKPPECDETWYCLQYLELLIEEILGDVEDTTPSFVGSNPTL